MLLLKGITKLKRSTSPVPRTYSLCYVGNVKSKRKPQLYLNNTKNKYYSRTVSSICVFTPGVGNSALGASQSTEQGHVGLRREGLRNYVKQFYYNQAFFTEPTAKIKQAALVSGSTVKVIYDIVFRLAILESALQNLKVNVNCS